MIDKEAMEIIKIAIAEVEWDYPMDYTVAFEKAIEALEVQGHRCENCDHRRNKGLERYWCNEKMMWVDADMHCSDWSEEDGENR